MKHCTQCFLNVNKIAAYFDEQSSTHFRLNCSIICFVFEKLKKQFNQENDFKFKRCYLDWSARLFITLSSDGLPKITLTSFIKRAI